MPSPSPQLAAIPVRHGRPPGRRVGMAPRDGSRGNSPAGSESWRVAADCVAPGEIIPFSGSKSEMRPTIQAAIHAFKEITSPYWLNEKRLKDHKIALIGEKIARAAMGVKGK